MLIPTQLLIPLMVIAVIYTILSVLGWIGTIQTIMALEKRGLRMDINLRPMAICLDFLAIGWWAYFVTDLFV